MELIGGGLFLKYSKLYFCLFQFGHQLIILSLLLIFNIPLLHYLILFHSFHLTYFLIAIFIYFSTLLINLFFFSNNNCLILFSYISGWRVCIFLGNIVSLVIREISCFHLIKGFHTYWLLEHLRIRCCFGKVWLYRLTLSGRFTEKSLLRRGFAQLVEK